MLLKMLMVMGSTLDLELVGSRGLMLTSMRAVSLGLDLVRSLFAVGAIGGLVTCHFGPVVRETSVLIGGAMSLDLVRLLVVSC